MARIVVRDIGMPSQVVQTPAVERPVIRVGAILTDSVGPAGKDGIPGRPGADGQPGTPGRDGDPGKSAYQIAVDSGFKGSVVEWLESLKGKDATIGSDILDKYVKKSGDQMNGTLSISNGFLQINHNDNPDENHLIINSYGGNAMNIESWGGDLVLNSGFRNVVVGAPGLESPFGNPKLRIVGNQMIGDAQYAINTETPRNGLAVQGDVIASSNITIEGDPYEDQHAATVQFVQDKAREEAQYQVNSAREEIKQEANQYTDQKIDESIQGLANDFVTTSSSQVVRGGKTFSDGITITDRSEQQTIRLSNNPGSGSNPDTLELTNKEGQDVIVRGVRKPSEDNDAANKAYVDSKLGQSGVNVDTSQFMPKSGGIFSGKVYANGGLNVPEPQADDDATSRKYVWSAIEELVEGGESRMRTTPKPSELGLISNYRADKAAFLPANQVTVEISSNNGSTWEDAGLTDSQKMRLFASNNQSSSIFSVTKDKQVRITIDQRKPNGDQERYAVIDRFYQLLSTENADAQIKIERSRLDNPDNFTTMTDWSTTFRNWPGAIFMRFPRTVWGGNPSFQGFQTRKIRFTYKVVGGNQDHFFRFGNIKLFGTELYTPPNELARTDTIYSWDEYQNARFPALVTADGGFNSDGVKQLVGTGFPEGVVSANVGSVYTDKNATNGAIRWIKKSGTGNTGWVVLHGDTGWRNISEVLSKGTGIGIELAEVKRVNDTVYWNIRLSGGKSNPVNKETVLWSMPEGFQMSQAMPFIAVHETADKDVPCIGKPAGGAIEVYRLQNNGHRIIIATTQTTSRGWPTTLPGTPV